MNPVIAPPARSRSTRRFTADAVSPTCGAEVGEAAPGVVDEQRDDRLVERVEPHGSISPPAAVVGWRHDRFAGPFRVDSEVGRLRQVILHRPGPGAEAAHPGQQGPAAVRRRAVGAARPAGARRVRRRCCATAGVTVHLFGELLREHRSTIPEARELRPRPDLRRARLRPDGDRRAAQLLRRDGRRHAHRAPGRRHHQARAARPHPGAALDRASTCSTPTTSCSSRCPTTSTPATPRPGSTTASSINSMRKKARMRETVALRGDLPLAPAVRRRAASRVWSDGSANGVATTEGGDILVLGGGAVLVGMSERTTAAGRRAAGAAAVRRRRGATGSSRCGMPRDPRADAPRHRDDDGRPGDVHQVRRARACCPPTRSSPGDTEKELHVTDHAPDDMHDAIAAALGLPAIRVLTAEQDVHAAEREQWDDGCNALARRARAWSSTYERNVTTNTYLRATRHRGAGDPGRRAGPRPRRPAVHELPDPARPAVTSLSSTARAGRTQVRRSTRGRSARLARHRALAADDAAQLRQPLGQHPLGAVRRRP